MQLDSLRLYRNMILGAMGGLTGWALITVFVRFDASSTWLLLLKDAVTGAVVGGCIGLALGVAAQSGSGWTRDKLAGCAAEAAASALLALPGWLRAKPFFCWLAAACGRAWLAGRCLACCLGAMAGDKDADPLGVYGALGGALGGLIGGSTYERLSRARCGVN